MFNPTANFFGQASFTYQVTDPEGGSTWATASLSIASVNDAPIIEDVWYGRPIYGYKATTITAYDDYGSAYTYVRYELITNAVDAMAHLHSGGELYKTQIDQLSNGEGGTYPSLSYHTYTPTYYHNGDIRPVAFDNNDATQSGSDEYGYYSVAVNDTYRQNGGVVAYDPDGNVITFSIGSDPQHGHAWVNQYVNAIGPEQLDHTQLSPYWVHQTGAWQYDSSKGDTYSGDDAFTVRVTDADGASTDVSINSVHASWSSGGGGGGGGCPVVVDLDGDGVELIAANDSHIFEDVNGDGWRERMGWVSSDDGFLALDRNGDGVIEGMKDISFAHDLPGTHTDLEGLSAHDTNGDGLISVNDTEWAKFGVWRDANSNGIQETGEFRSLSDLGIESIGLTSDGQIRVDHGNVVFGETQVNLTSGKSLVAADVMLAGQDVAYPIQVEDALLAQQAEVMRKALLFNQVCTTSVTTHEVTLGFVDTSDPSWHGVIEPAHDSLLDSRSMV